MTHIELYREESRFKDPAEWADPPPGLAIEPGDYRWSMVHTNGKTIGASTQGYGDKRDMIWNLLFVTGGKFDHGGTVLKRPRLGRYPGFRWERFEVHDKTKEKP